MKNPEDNICPSCLQETDGDFRYDEDLDVTICLGCFYEIWLAGYIPHFARQDREEFRAKIANLADKPSRFSFVRVIEVN